MINSDTAKTVYTALAGQVQFDIGFTYFTNPDNSPQIKVSLNSFYDTPLVYGTGYTLSGDGLKVVLATAPGAGVKVYISRDVPLTQKSDYSVGRIDPEQIEKDLDTAVMRDQELHEIININSDDVADLYNTIHGYGDIVTHDVSEFATATQGGKADTAVQPGDLASVATTGTLDSLSNVTITTPSNGENLTYDAINQVWKNTTTTVTVAWGGITGTLSDQSDLKNALDSTVHLAGVETITGDKTYTKNVVIKNSELDSTIAPVSYTERLLLFYDKNGERVGYIGTSMDAGSTDIRSFFGSCREVGGVTYYSTVSTYIDSNGDPWALISKTPDVTDDSRKIATTEFVRDIIPAGIIVPYGGSSAPAGWLKCDGSAVSRTTYADLFSVIGTTYGSGDGSTTFNLPPAHVNPLGLYAGVFSSSNNKRMAYDVGNLTGGTNKVIGISDVDRYTSVWTPATSGTHSDVYADAQGTATGSGTWATMYSNNATASGALAINIIKY